MKITSFTTIDKEDFEGEQQELVDKLSYTINPFFQQIYQAFTNGLSFKDNFYGQSNVIKVKVDATGVPNNGQIKYTLKTRPQTIMFLNVINLTDRTGLVSAPYAGFSMSGDILNIDYITGLLPNKEYQLSLFILG